MLPIGVGTFRLKHEAVKPVIRDALRIGYRHIDTAAIYQNEKEIGEVLQEIFNEPSSTIKRSDLWITSKLSPYDMKTPRAALLKSLASLQTNYLDLYLIHWPGVSRLPPTSPQHKRLRIEAWNVLNKAKQEGLVRHIGVSNFTPQHIQELIDETKYGFQSAFVQMEIHPWYWRDALEIQTRFAQYNITIVGYALLAEGKLLGVECPRILDEVAERLGLSRVQVVLAWALAKKWGVLVKSENAHHLRENLEVHSLKELTLEDSAAIDAVSSADNEEKFCWDPRLVK
ncbi:NADP-dependent oxidoreductase domain-containing protein [Xylogone sp. PMI_703]|nr:NADP-dependent oxidoreductase domain-containing protein [Xylogone sp. PMI_703]